MLIPALTALLLAAPAAADAPPPSGATPKARGGFLLSEHIILRVPLPGRRARASPPPVRWREGKAARCIDMKAIAGAAVAPGANVDFVLKGGKRVRARLDRDCPALDYYSGFYLASPGDGRICADRDSVHARSGGACEIARFRSLKPDKP